MNRPNVAVNFETEASRTFREAREALREALSGYDGSPPDCELPPVTAYSEDDKPAPRKNGAKRDGTVEPSADAKAQGIARKKAHPPIDWSQCAGTPPPREWWVPEWLGPWPMLCSGLGGVGKTKLVQAIGTSLATGRAYLGEVTRAHSADA